jgi:hypothetical protein
MDNNALDENPNCEETYATSRCVGVRLEPSAISDALGLTPDFACYKGEEFHSKAGILQRGIGVWYIESRNKVVSTSVERHILYLLDNLEPRMQSLLMVMEGFGLETEIFCKWVSASGHGGPVISPETMRRISALRAYLTFDFYGPYDDEA